jgi:spore maturation protein CgeB
LVEDIEGNMAKVMYLPLRFGDVQLEGVCDAFIENDCQLEVFDYFKESKESSTRLARQKLINKAEEFKPDLLHLQIQHTNIIDAATVLEIKKRCPKTIITNINVDARNYVQDTYRQIAVYADFNFICSTGQLELYKSVLGKDVYFWQIGYDPKLYHPLPTKDSYEFDVVFIANNNVTENYPGQPEREKTCQILRNTFGGRFGLFGNGWPSRLQSRGGIDQKKVNEYYNKANVCLSVSHFNNISHYFSDRLLMCMASGRPTISLTFPHWQSYFADHCDLVITNTIEDLVPKIKWLVENPDIANHIGQQGAAKVYAEHTYFSRIKELLEVIGLR